MSNQMKVKKTKDGKKYVQIELKEPEVVNMKPESLVVNLYNPRTKEAEKVEIPINEHNRKSIMDFLGFSVNANQIYGTEIVLNNQDGIMYTNLAKKKDEENGNYVYIKGYKEKAVKANIIGLKINGHLINYTIHNFMSVGTEAIKDNNRKITGVKVTPEGMQKIKEICNSVAGGKTETSLESINVYSYTNSNGNNVLNTHVTGTGTTTVTPPLNIIPSSDVYSFLNSPQQQELNKQPTQQVQTQSETPQQAQTQPKVPETPAPEVPEVDISDEDISF